MILRGPFLGVWLLCAMAQPAFADYDYLFCSRTSSWVEAGDTSAQVLAKCGPPTRIDEIRIGSGRRSIVTPRWIYDFGSTSFVRFVLFSRDRVIRIATGDYGQSQLLEFPGADWHSRERGDGSIPRFALDDGIVPAQAAANHGFEGQDGTDAPAAPDGHGGALGGGAPGENLAATADHVLMESAVAGRARPQILFQRQEVAS